MLRINDYKTPAIYNLLTYLKKNLPHATHIIDKYSPQFKNIDLSEDNCDYSLGEVYIQSIDFVTNETVYLIWNIDHIIQEIERTHVPPRKISPSIALQNSRFVMPDFQKTLKVVQRNASNKFPHKSNYVIFGELPVFPGITIIDGNHRFCEAILQNQKTINAYFVNPDAASKFLQPDSCKFITLFSELLSRIDP